MSDNKLGNIEHQEADTLIRHLSMLNEIINIDGYKQFNHITKIFPDKIVVIDFWAAECAPCKRYLPIFAQAHQKYYMDYVFAKINVNENPDLAQYFGITSIPSTLLVKGTQVLRKFTGALNFETLKQILEKFMS
jgi:thioredoxin